MHHNCLQGRLLPEADALALLRRSSRSALWRYLRHLISLPASSNDDALHMELAMVLIDEAQDLSRLADLQHVEPRQHGGADGRGGDAGELRLVRRQLQAHLASSGSYDVGALLERLAGTRLYEERVIVHAKARTFPLPQCTAHTPCVLRPDLLFACS